jgi:hypothetical protein
MMNLDSVREARQRSIYASGGPSLGRFVREHRVDFFSREPRHLAALSRSIVADCECSAA